MTLNHSFASSSNGIYMPPRIHFNEPKPYANFKNYILQHNVNGNNFPMDTTKEEKHIQFLCCFFHYELLFTQKKKQKANKKRLLKCQYICRKEKKTSIAKFKTINYIHNTTNKKTLIIRARPLNSRAFTFTKHVYIFVS